MTHHEQRLLRHVIIAVCIKLVVLMALWWLFVRDARVSVDAEHVAEKISGATTIQGVSQ